MKFYIGQCARCGSELTEESLKKNRCVSCGTPIVLSDQERYKKTVRLYEDLKEFLGRRRYADAQKIYNSSDFHKLFEKDELFSFYGLFLDHAVAPSVADKQRSFTNYLKQNTDGRLGKEEKSEIEGILTGFESTQKETVCAIAGFLLGGRSPSKIENGDAYVLYCIANAGLIGTDNLVNLITSDGLSPTNKVKIIQQSGEACQSLPDKSAVKGFLYLCKTALGVKGFTEDHKREIAALLDALCNALDSHKLKNKAARLIRKGGLKREGAEGGKSLVLEAARKKTLKIVAVAAVAIFVILLTGTLVYGSRPVGIEAVADNKTAYIYQDELDLHYKVNRTFSWMESGAIKTGKLKAEGYDPEKIGEQEITVTYNGLSKKLIITIAPRTLAAPTVTADNGILTLSGGLDYGYTVTMDGESVSAATGFDMKTWAPAQSLSPDAYYTVTVSANGDGSKLLNSANTEIIICKLSEPEIIQTGDQISYTQQDGASHCTIKYGGELLCELTGDAYTLDSFEFLPGNNTLEARAIGGGRYLDSNPAEVIVKKAQTPSFSVSDIEEYAIQNAQGLECWYRPAGEDNYLRTEGLISNLNALPGEAGQYEVVLRAPSSASKMSSDYSIPLTFTRLAAPHFDKDPQNKIIVSASNYELHCKQTDGTVEVYNGSPEDYFTAQDLGRYLVQAVALPEPDDKLTLPSVLADFGVVPYPNYNISVSNENYLITWNFVFGSGEAAWIRFKIVSGFHDPQGVIAKNDQFSYYSVYDYQEDYHGAHVFAYQDNWLLFANYD